MYTPNTQLRLLHCDIEKDQQNQILFDSEGARTSYFETRDGRTFIDFKYVTSELDGIGYIKVNTNIDSIRSYNYVMYQNSNFNSKWFYAFVERMEFKGENVTHIYIKLDVIQTWWDYLTFGKSFVERAHWYKDADYYNTLSDIVPTGNLIIHNTEKKILNGAYFIFCNADVSQDDTSTGNNTGFRIGDYFLPCYTIYYPDGNENALNNLLLNIGNKGRGDRILACVYVPYVPETITTTSVQADIGTYMLATSATGYEEYAQGLTNTEMTGYCKKCFTFPYSKIVVEDNATGQSIELQPEKFNEPLFPSFVMQGTINTTPSYRIIPSDYRGKEKDYSNMLVVTCDTSLPTYNNLYASYMMLNKSSNELATVMGVAGMGLSAISLNGTGVLGGIEAVTNVVLQENKAGKQGNQVNSFKDSAMQRILFENSVSFSQYIMDLNHFVMAYSYWKMYGYPRRCVEYPNLTSSDFNYNYIKLINPNITGEIPQEDMQEIKSIFSNGITLWHTSTSFMEY